MTRFFLQVAIAALVFASGCRRVNRLAEIEAKERTSSYYRDAHAAEQSGNLDEAVTLLNRVLIERPKDYSAHFQLATLLHDHVQDYIGAIYHYRRYLELRGNSEKTELAKDRLRIAEQMLAPQILKKVGNSVEGISQVRLIKEVEKLNAEISTLTGEKAAMKEQMDAQTAKMKEIESDNARLRKILDKMREAPAPSATVSIPKRETPPAAESRKTVAKREKAAAASRKPLPKRESVPNPDTRLTSEELRRLRAEAAQLSSATARNRGDAAPGKTEAVEPPKGTSPVLEEEDDGSKSDEEFLSRFIKRTTRIKGEDGAAKTQPERRRTYVVKPGDTLGQVSEKFYGTKTQWKKIRDANRATIDPDGRIRPGQIIVVP